MIKITPENSSGKIAKIEYRNNGFEKIIHHKISIVTNLRDSNNIGTILENYRNKFSANDEYFNENKAIFDNYINTLSLSFDNFEPDQIVCFLPAEKNRKQLLKEFVVKVKLFFKNENIIDHSDKFLKKDISKSIKDGLTKDDYELLHENKMTLIKSLLIVDDTIDKGDTLNIYLDKLYEQNLMDNNTTIYLICIYNNAKFEKVDYLKFKTVND